VGKLKKKKPFFIFRGLSGKKQKGGGKNRKGFWAENVLVGGGFSFWFAFPGRGGGFVATHKTALFETTSCGRGQRLSGEKKKKNKKKNPPPGGGGGGGAAGGKQIVFFFYFGLPFFRGFGGLFPLFPAGAGNFFFYFWAVFFFVFFFIFCFLLFFCWFLRFGCFLATPPRHRCPFRLVLSFGCFSCCVFFVYLVPPRFYPTPFFSPPGFLFWFFLVFLGGGGRGGGGCVGPGGKKTKQKKKTQSTGGSERTRARMSGSARQGQARPERHPFRQSFDAFEQVINDRNWWVLVHPDPQDSATFAPSRGVLEVYSDYVSELVAQIEENQWRIGAAVCRQSLPAHLFVYTRTARDGLSVNKATKRILGAGKASVNQIHDPYGIPNARNSTSASRRHQWVASGMETCRGSVFDRLISKYVNDSLDTSWVTNCCRP